MANSISARYVRVLIDRTEGTLLDYEVPEHLAKQAAIGSRVRVPLRRV